LVIATVDAYFDTKTLGCAIGFCGMADEVFGGSGKASTAAHVIESGVDFGKALDGFGGSLRFISDDWQQGGKWPMVRVR